MVLQGIRSISSAIVQDPAINSGRPIIQGTRVFVDRIIGHLENDMSMSEICQEYDLIPEQVIAVKQLSLEQVQHVKGYADALENVAETSKNSLLKQDCKSPSRHYDTKKA